MAGGDGSQAVVAAMAADFNLPYACVPAGTRNHFALDLGVDRDDVVGALDAFVDGGERRVDLAEVNGRVFVNNVSLGLYAEAVQRPGYREAKLRTILDTVPEMLGTGGKRARSRLAGPRRQRARLGGRRAGLEQPLPARDGRRIGHAPADRRRAARNHGHLGADGERAGPPRATAMARVVGGRVRGAVRACRSGRHRRRGGVARPAAAIPDQARRPRACEFPRNTRGPLRPRPSPKPPWDGIRALVDIAGGRTPQTKET